MPIDDETDDFMEAVLAVVSAHIPTRGRQACAKGLIGIGVGLFFTVGLSVDEVRDKLTVNVNGAWRLYKQEMANRRTD